MTKPLQNYIEEEVKLFEEKFVPLKPGFSELKDWTKNLEGTTANYMTLKDFLSQSLHRIAKITAEEIVPNDEGTIKIENDLYNKKDVYGYGQALSDLQTKIKEFIK